MRWIGPPGGTGRGGPDHSGAANSLPNASLSSLSISSWRCCPPEAPRLRLDAPLPPLRCTRCWPDRKRGEEGALPAWKRGEEGALPASCCDWAKGNANGEARLKLGCRAATWRGMRGLVLPAPREGCGKGLGGRGRPCPAVSAAPAAAAAPGGRWQRACCPRTRAAFAAHLSARKRQAPTHPRCHCRHAPGVQLQNCALLTAFGCQGCRRCYRWRRS